MNTILLETALASFLLSTSSIKTIQSIEHASNNLNEHNSKLLKLMALSKDQRIAFTDAAYNKHLQVSQEFRNSEQPMAVIQDLIKLKEHCFALIGDINFDPRNLLKELSNDIDNLLDTYQSFLKTNSATESINFAESIKCLTSKLNEIRSIHSLMTSFYDSDNFAIDDSFQYLTIGLCNKATKIDDISRKITGISECYYAIANIFYDEKIIPLQIIKLETGSTWIKAIGSGLIVPILVNVLSEAVKYQYTEYTNTQTISSFEGMDLGKLNTIIQLRDNVNKSGVKTPELDQSIQKALRVLSRSLDKSLHGEAEIRINDQQYSITSDDRKAYLELTSTKNIETKEVQDHRRD